MRYETHIVTSVTMGVGLTMITDAPLSLGYGIGVILGSLLPDIDEPRSYIGQRSFGIAKLINKMFGHRGFTHSFLAALPFFILFYFFPYSFVLGLACGYLFHITGDFFSKSGVPLFYPFTKKRYKIPIYITGKTSEKVVLFFSILVLVFLSLKIAGIV